MPEATIEKAVIDDAKEIYVDPVRIDLAFDERREWKDPYEMLGISPPETEEENAEGVPYKNIKILFTMNKYFKGGRRVTLTFNKLTGVGLVAYLFKPSAVSFIAAAGLL